MYLPELHNLKDFAWDLVRPHQHLLGGVNIVTLGITSLQFAKLQALLSRHKTIHPHKICKVMSQHEKLQSSSARHLASQHIPKCRHLPIGQVPRRSVLWLILARWIRSSEFVPTPVFEPVDQSENQQIYNDETKENGKYHLSSAIMRGCLCPERLRSDPVSHTIRYDISYSSQRKTYQ